MRSQLFAAVLLAFCALPCVTPSVSAQPLTDSMQVRTAYIFAGIEGFIPTRTGYRLNYSTRLAGLPIELSGGLMFPVSPDILTPLTVRYIHRKANFIENSSVSVLSIEPGIRVFLEKQRTNDIRVFAGGDLLLAQAKAESMIDVSQDGTVSGTSSAQKNYLNLGLGLDLGFAYPLTSISSLDAVVHGAYYFGSALAHGGIGDIGGISIGLLYRYGF